MQSAKKYAKTMNELMQDDILLCLQHLAQLASTLDKVVVDAGKLYAGNRASG